MPTTEKTVTRQIREYLQKSGWMVWKNFGGPMTRAGLPDLMAVKDGRFIAIEVKSPTGAATKLQLNTIQQFQSHGILAFVARSVADVAAQLLD